MKSKSKFNFQALFSSGLIPTVSTNTVSTKNLYLVSFGFFAENSCLPLLGIRIKSIFNSYGINWSSLLSTAIQPTLLIKYGACLHVGLKDTCAITPSEDCRIIFLIVLTLNLHAMLTAHIFPQSCPLAGNITFTNEH